MSIGKLTVILLFILIVWTFVIYGSQKNRSRRRAFKLLCVVIMLASMYGILSYTVLQRVPTNRHRFVWISEYSGEFWRELFMNALLFVPLGMCLSPIMGVKSVLLALAFSVVIEAWQYCTGTGLAQGTDLIMNTIGALIGIVPWEIIRIAKNKGTIE